jgi:Yip1 domain
MSDNPSIPSPVPHLTQVGRVVNTFVAPARTFADVSRERSWWLPFLITVVFTYLFFWAAATKVGFRQLTLNSMSENPSAMAQFEKLSPDQQVARLSVAATFTKGIFIAWPVFALIIVAVFALILWGCLKVPGGQADFTSIFTVLMYAGLIPLVKLVLGVVVLFAAGDASGFDINNPIPTNPGAFMDASSAHWLKTLATSFDVILIWNLVVVAIGCAIVSKLKKGSAMAVVFGLWILVVLCKVAWAAALG